MNHPPPMKLRHLQREVATALELALVALAPNAIIDSLANAAGLLVALSELPLDNEALSLWAKDATERAERTLATWEAWQVDRRPTA
ncbi:MAG: hypothetical protein JWN44_5649 [Myxococcales bacterium]|nr:hypothetical protein [Myxococcales bacterium]